MTITHYIAAFVLTALASYHAVREMRCWGERKGMMDLPNERSLHSRPVVRGGGLPIVLLSLCGWLLGGLLLRPYPLYMILAYAGGAAFIALVGWLDDLRPLPSLLRFAVHGCASLLFIRAFGYPTVIGLPAFGELHMGWLGLPLALFWLVGLTNAYNFMDGADGIAGGQGIVAGLGWFVLGCLGGQQLTALLGLLLAAGCFGFLGHNWAPAKVFMGDVSSTFLGFTFAAAALMASREDPRLLTAGALLVWPFVFDTLFTLALRLGRGENLAAAHRSHLYQRLIIAGFKHSDVSALYMGCAAAGAALAFLWLGGFFTAGWLVYLIFGVLCFSLWLFTALVTASGRGSFRSMK